MYDVEESGTQIAGCCSLMEEGLLWSWGLQDTS